MKHQFPFRSPAAFALAIAAVVSPLQGVLAQQHEKQAAPVSGPGAIALADEVFRFDPVGLTMRLPVGSTTQSTRVGGRAAVTITPADMTWVLSIQTPQTTNVATTPAEAADQALAALLGSFGVLDPDQTEVKKTQAEIIQKTENLSLPGGSAARFYVSLPQGTEGGSRIFKGYTFFKPSPSQFVIFEMMTSEGEFAKAKGVYETTIGTAKFQDLEAMLVERGGAIKAGVALFGNLTEADYVNAMPREEVWHRLYRPALSGAPADAEEIGYRGLRFARGKRGEIDPTTPKGHWTKTDQQDGYLVHLRARVLTEKVIADTVGSFFMTPDRREEAWSIRSVFIERATGKRVGGASETGARYGDELTVQRIEPGSPTKTIPMPILGEGYLSQFESYLLPYVAIRKGVKDELGDLGFYCYQPDPGVVAFRRDTFKREHQPGGAIWTVKTLFRDDAAPQIARYTDRGELIRTEMDDGRVWEPMSLEQLYRLWHQKGLPVEKEPLGR